jgi:aldehyde dehydrogenase (NAD+)
MTARELFDLQAAHRWTMARTTAAQRIERLERLRGAIRERRAELCEAIRADFGKHPVESELTEMLPVLEEIALTTRHLHRWMRPRRVGTPMTLWGSRSELRYEPLGQVLVLAPWNYPFQLVANPLVAAVAAGNCVIVRPSEKTPSTSAFVRDLVASVFPENEVAVVLGGRDLADALLALPFDHIFFTGSTAVGRTVMAAAARHLASVTLELGGKSPVVVDESADLDSAAERIAWGKFINAGQTCVAPDYALVQESVATRFVDALARAIARLYGEDESARAANTDLARMVDERSSARLGQAIDQAVASGARVVVGGHVDVPSRRVTPTVVTNVRVDSLLMSEEIFGPVLPVLTWRSLDEALTLIRERPKPLALYIFSRDRSAIETVLSSTTAGGTCVNNVVVHLANPHLPFGGVGASGAGQYHGRFGFEQMSHPRAVLTQTMPSSLKLFFPPYTNRSSQLLGWLRKIAG